MKDLENKNDLTFKASKDFIAKSYIKKDDYDTLYKESINDPEKFWGKMSKNISWIKEFSQVKDVSFKKNDLHISWFKDGILNVSYNCIDIHLDKKANDIALIYEADEPRNSKKITYQQLHDEVCKFANLLKQNNVKKHDRITIYMPMICEAVYAMLACARIGAIHSVVFGGFSPEALAQRLIDCDSKLIITCNEGKRGGKVIPLKNNVDEALKIKGVDVKTIIVFKHTSNNVHMEKNRDIYYHEVEKTLKNTCEIEPMSAEDALFILYTSGSTGKPKGVLHASAGYLVYASLTFKWVFDYKDGDIYWCTADVGWVTGHSYIVYGPLANGATTLIFEGMPTYPDASRFWQICEEHKVNIFYTAPTAIRTLMKAGDEYVKKYDLSSLKLLGSVGEPINPKAWLWYYDIVGNKKCPIVDTWWQTETGGIMLTSLPGAHLQKPGSAGLPFFGINPILVNDLGEEVNDSGNLCIKDSWPGQASTLYNNHKRFYETYFETFPNKYFSGDSALKDSDGYFHITGRVDDVMNISGHRIGTAEVESALVSSPYVAEAAVVSYAHDIKGEAIYAYVTLMKDVKVCELILKEIKACVKKEIGSIAVPEIIQFSPALPRTRSGKIMRRILRKIASNEYEDLGDISTLANSSVVGDIIEVHKELI
ncbi:MAG: acetate--CoA ligase [Campylobacterales bacterium]|nr:acetate--CoA ligase [Campylobacterales bacterium]